MHPLLIFLICALSLFLVALIAFFFHFSNSAIKITQYSQSAKIACDSLKICQVSDLHAKEFGKENAKLLAKISENAPDVIAITGDIIHKYRQRDFEVALNFVKNATKIAPVIFVSGNHEMRNKNYKTFAKNLTDAGSLVLDNAITNVKGVRFCGLNCAHLKNATPFNLDKGDGFSILLAHKPEYLYQYARAGYDLVLSGHAHGGQWRLPFTNVGIYSPGQGLFPKYTSGVHVSGNTKMIISRGLGNSQFPLRLFNRPELVFITINKK
jgi:predicted MPP superfamily phosphohydrolase